MSDKKLAFKKAICVSHFSFDTTGAKEKLTKESATRVSRSAERDSDPVRIRKILILSGSEIGAYAAPAREPFEKGSIENF